MSKTAKIVLWSILGVILIVILISVLTSLLSGGKEINYSVGLFAEGKQEYAVTAYTEYNDGSRTPTLVLSLPGEDGYAVYFYGAEKDKEN